MDIRLTQHTSQKLILSPQMRQYLKLLQLPACELEQAVEEEISQNPLLEEKTVDLAPPSDKVEETPEVTRPAHDRIETHELRLGETFDHLMQIDEECDGYKDAAFRNPTDLQRTKDYRESLITKSEALSDFLFWQIRFLDLSEDEIKIAEEIIGNLNEDGFLTLSNEEIAKTMHLSTDKIEKALAKLQEMDPPGICAQNLREALLIQLRRKDPLPLTAVQMLEKYFHLVARRDWTQIAKLLHISVEEVRAAAQVISKLEPKPGRIFFQDENSAIIPDASITFDDDDEGKLKIEVHQEFLPELRISPYYRRMLRMQGTKPEVKAFIREKIQSALNFLHAISLRKSTLSEITHTIVKMQPEFFTKGFSHLKPMRLKDIAEELGIHESTVSRALSGKYISTPQGTLPFKSFFSAKLENSAGDDESQKSIMEKVRYIVDHEDKKRPLSDLVIAEQLKKEGIKIARRTVTKYRELLKIYPAHLRRET